MHSHSHSADMADGWILGWLVVLLLLVLSSSSSPSSSSSSSSHHHHHHYHILRRRYHHHHHHHITIIIVTITTITIVIALSSLLTDPRTSALLPSPTGCRTLIFGKASQLWSSSMSAPGGKMPQNTALCPPKKNNHAEMLKKNN